MRIPLGFTGVTEKLSTKCLCGVFSLGNMGWTSFHLAGNSYNSGIAAFSCALLYVHA